MTEKGDRYFQFARNTGATRQHMGWPMKRKGDTQGRQRLALASPCDRHEEAVPPQYMRLSDDGVGTILMVHVGDICVKHDGMPAWHASVSFSNKAAPGAIHVNCWTRSMLRKATNTVEDLLNGVGDRDHELYVSGNNSMHLYRRLHADEVRALHKTHPDAPVFVDGRAMELLQ